MHVVILGAPGSGKGTQSAEIVNHFSLTHLSTGDMLRHEIEIQSELGLAAKKIMDAGDLVSDEIILGMVSKQIEKSQTGFLFDGFPRTIAQAKGLDAILEKQNQHIDKAIQLNVDDHEIIERMLARGRADDNEETIRNRLNVYNQQTAPLIDFYNKQNKLHTIEAMGSVESIFTKIQQILAS